MTCQLRLPKMIILEKKIKKNEKDWLSIIGDFNEGGWSWIGIRGSYNGEPI